MTERSTPWRISHDEWERHRHQLQAEPNRRDDDRERLLAQACLFRYFNSLSRKYRTFGWHRLPKAAAGRISAATANRRFNEWTRTGRLFAFWSVLERDRQKLLTTAPNSEGPSEVVRTIQLLERAYRQFNAERFHGNLPSKLRITVEHHPRLEGEFRGRLPVPWIAVMDSALRKGEGHILQVLLHQMVHLFNFEAGVQDVGRADYHNRYFRDVALMAGLECRYGSKGYAYTRLSGPPDPAAVRQTSPDRVSL